LETQRHREHGEKNKRKKNKRKEGKARIRGRREKQGEEDAVGSTKRAE
jgi:hypothetical protein